MQAKLTYDSEADIARLVFADDAVTAVQRQLPAPLADVSVLCDADEHVLAIVVPEAARRFVRLRPPAAQRDSVYLHYEAEFDVASLDLSRRFEADAEVVALTRPPVTLRLGPDGDILSIDIDKTGRFLLAGSFG